MSRYTPAPDFAISVAQRRATGVPGRTTERRQPMRGFDDAYVDVVDWVIRSTDRIWEDQDIGYIYDCYAPDCRVYKDGGLEIGVEPVVESTVARINAFPDARHYADDVIWAGSEDEGFATSHRAINVGYHTGPWGYGPASGRKINTWVIANCVAREEVYFEEWLLGNLSARLLQCGVDLVQAARQLGNDKAFTPIGDRQMTEAERLVGGRPPRPHPAPDHSDGFDVEGFCRALWHDAYNRRDLSVFDRTYERGVRWHGPTNREGYGIGMVRQMARELLATFPDLGVQVDEVYWMGNEAEGFSVSVRWSGLGTHRGTGGIYGQPTGRRVFVWGLSQLYVREGRVHEDWMLFNELDVLAQLLRDDAPTLLA